MNYFISESIINECCVFFYYSIHSTHIHKKDKDPPNLFISHPTNKIRHNNNNNRILHFHFRTPIHIRLLRSNRRHLLIQPHSLPPLQRNRHDIASSLLLIDSINQQSLLLRLTPLSLSHLLQFLLSSHRPQHFPQRYQRRQHQHDRHVRVELVAQKLDRLHLSQQRGQRDGRVLRVVQLQQHHEVVAERELDSTDVLRVERQRVHVRVVVVQAVRVHKGDPEQEPRPEEANEQVH